MKVIDLPSADRSSVPGTGELISVLSSTFRFLNLSGFQTQRNEDVEVDSFENDAFLCYCLRQMMIIP